VATGPAGRSTDATRFLTDLMPRREDLPTAVAVGILGPLLILLSRFRLEVSHNAAETFGVVVALGIFMMVWNARRFLDNQYYLFLGIAYLFVGGIDYIHALSFDGFLPGDSPNLHAQFWYAGRFLQSAALLIAPAFADRKLKPAICFAVFAAATFSLLSCILAGNLFPDFLRHGTEATWTKFAATAAVAAAQGAAVVLLFRKRVRFDGAVLRLLAWSILFSIAAELAGGIYKDGIVYNNLLGHYLKIVSFYLAYKAVIATGLRKPYDLLFLTLRRSEEEIRAARDGLESRVAERTEELRAANSKLEQELLERQRALAMRELILDLHQLTHAAGGVQEFLQSLTPFLRDRFRCDAVGIRYRRGADFPYFDSLGFPREFLEAEMRLCPANRGARREDAPVGKPTHECLCGSVIEGRIDSSLSCFTPNGTFWTNAASDLYAASGEVRAAATRGRCLRHGYESIALVPLRAADVTFGLLQLTDRRKGLFEPYLIAQLERIAENVGATLSRLLTREALQESEDRFRSLVENSLVGILIVVDGRIVFRNPESERLLGPIPEGIPFRELGEVHLDDMRQYKLLCDAMAEGDAAMHAADLRYLAGGSGSSGSPTKWIHIRTSPIEHRGRMATLVNLVDVTRVKDLEQIATTREKLVSLGQLAAGISHEIRNPLSGINVNVSALELLCRRFDGMTSEEEARIGATVGKIRLASEKIASVIRRVMDFSKPVPPKLGQVDLNGVIEEALQMSEASLRRSGIEILKILDPRLPKCQADPRLLEQVLLNLISNAVQAMESCAGGRRLEVTSCRERDRVVVRVADSGPGVPANLRSKIFDPFYTTRKDGHGIGLSFSNRVIADHNGRLDLSTSRFGGAEFRIEIPLEKALA
jgi:PAS domain S-box-containing protein